MGITFGVLLKVSINNSDLTQKKTQYECNLKKERTLGADQKCKITQLASFSKFSKHFKSIHFCNAT